MGPKGHQGPRGVRGVAGTLTCPAGFHLGNLGIKIKSQTYMIHTCVGR
jgi:hypothetical protein